MAKNDQFQTSWTECKKLKAISIQRKRSWIAIIIIQTKHTHTHEKKTHVVSRRVQLSMYTKDGIQPKPMCSLLLSEYNRRKKKLLRLIHKVERCRCCYKWKMFTCFIQQNSIVSAKSDKTMALPDQTGGDRIRVRK